LAGASLALGVAAVWLRFGEGRRIVRFAPVVARSVLSAMRSPRFLNIFAAAAGLAALSRRFGAGTYATRKRTFFVSVWALYYYFRVRERARIHFQRTSWNRMLVEKAMLARRRFSPVPWAFNRHAQFHHLLHPLDDAVGVAAAAAHRARDDRGAGRQPATPGLAAAGVRPGRRRGGGAAAAAG
jgi:hypothetical protein